MEVVLGVAAVVFLILAVIFLVLWQKKGMGVSQSEYDHLKAENQQMHIQEGVLHERIKSAQAEKESLSTLLRQENDKLAQQLAHERAELASASQALESTRSYYQAEKDKLREQKAEIEQLRQHFQREFENVSARLLKERSLEFMEASKGQLDHILNPLKENIKAFEEKVEKVYNAEAAERNVLKGEINRLMELNRLMSVETQNLTRALKGDNKKQGNWGEFILEKVLERSGLIKDREYRLQAAHEAQDGTRFMPDAIIDLPDGKHLIIDSKVSLIAYERLVNADTEDERKLFAKEHVMSLRNHVMGLSSKNYHDLQKLNSPDFVLLFVPIESSFSFAVQLDADLFNDAWDKRVVIVSPSTLLATLRTIASMWKQERQNRNVMEIARLSGDMYDKFVGFLTDMDSIGRNLKQSQDAYEKALNKLSEGRGNLTATAERIKGLGAKANKQIPPSALKDDLE
ncbi:DNA recombination protein RmuC [Mucilaginibacter daejeonensis]|uniref:DNA recombination protein RmuC n=1 Tax=Mucilaginibacter daejeonensis TaxID=398049 RepID=UPI001D175F77|nr:DNA recombination protein RmuC [Mucilaginibacter daejeonensis]UEG53179.1 DNA recombination protein RmuC [Mucilaginibacter daejeonensis]